MGKDTYIGTDLSKSVPVNAGALASVSFCVTVISIRTWLLTIGLQVVDDFDRDGVSPLRVDGWPFTTMLVTLCSEKLEAEQD